MILGSLYRGDTGEEMVVMLNHHLLIDELLNPKLDLCENFDGKMMYSHLDSKLNDIYNENQDHRKLRYDS